MLQRSMFILLVFACAGLVLGCGSDSDSGSPQAAPNEKDKITKALDQLSDEDRKAALQQKDCPVSGSPLGSMGVPIKISVKGQDVFICCSSCKKSLTENPEKYLKKLKDGSGKD